MTKNFSLQPSYLSPHTSALSPLLLADVPGITVHKQPAVRGKREEGRCKMAA